MALCCEHDDRRGLVRRRKGWNGLDYVELDADETVLRAYFLGKLPPEFAAPQPNLARHLVIEGGVRITGLTITAVEPVVDPDPERDDHLRIQVNRIGDFSVYTLRLVDVEDVDPRYDSADFRFRLGCPSDLDCAPAAECPVGVSPAPEINYLAKDYASFRQLVLDRLALIMPDWRERHAPDLGIMLVELLAYEGDLLSYYQDAVATEATLDTARLRVSVRRHARLLDYRMHEGCNARAFVCIQTDTDLTLDPGRIAFVSGLADQALPTILDWDGLADIPADRYHVFEPLVPAGTTALKLRAAHGQISFYTFGDTICQLAAGSTSASLVDRGLHLAVGDVLILEEVRGRRSGLPADADPARRHPVRLVSVQKRTDPITRDGEGHPVRYLEVTWAAEDALPFPLCLSAIGAAPDCRFIADVSVARANVLLVDHGRTMPSEDLGAVPAGETIADCLCANQPGPAMTVAGRYNPGLALTPVTWAVPLQPALPASAMTQQDPCATQAAVRLTSVPSFPWEPRYDLIDSRATDAAFVVENDNDGRSRLRFGDGRSGLMPPAGARFAATYRIGNGPDGNVGADAITRLVLSTERLTGVSMTVRNPLPASGGRVPESIAQAKLMAPHAFRTRLARAIVADDYATLAARHRAVSNATAQLVWTGSWYDAEVAIDPMEPSAGDDLLADVSAYLEPYRRIGHDLHVQPAVAVPIDLAMEVCVRAGYRRSDVKRALLASFGTGTSPDGTQGFFHPDLMTFGQGIKLSRIIARAHAVAGVESVVISRFQRLLWPPNHEIENGLLPLATGEVACLDGDPNRPERGQLQINIRGGH